MNTTWGRPSRAARSASTSSPSVGAYAMSNTPSKRRPASARARAAWSFRSHARVWTPAGSRAGCRPRFSAVTTWPRAWSERTRCRLMNSVPPTTRAFIAAAILAHGILVLGPGDGGRRESDMARDVTATWLGSLKTEAWVGPHRVTSDEPVDHGGDDTGPTPVDFVLVALTA